MYTLDTNVLVYHLHDDKRVRDFMDTAAQNLTRLYLSVITEAELLRWPQLSRQEESAIMELLPAFSIVPMDSHIARQAGSIGRIYNLKLADSIIAATALFTGSTLVTRNMRDFRHVPLLALQSI